jgi:hypothetical protein
MLFSNAGPQGESGRFSMRNEVDSAVQTSFLADKSKRSSMLISCKSANTV